MDPSTHELTPAAADVLAAARPAAGPRRPRGLRGADRAAHAAVRATPHEATGDAGREPRRGGGRGRDADGSRTPPDRRLGRSDIVDKPRYHEVAESMRDLFGRTPEAALHVHVGMPDPETAIRVFNGLRRHLPLLIGLSANSPWWFGHDSGLASARWALVRSYPGRGIPPTFASWDALPRAPRRGSRPAAGRPTTRSSGGTSARTRGSAPSRCASSTRRPRSTTWRRSPRSTQALARREAEAPAAELPPAEAIAWACFRAARDGLDAEILHDGRLMPLRDAARAAGGGARRRRRSRSSSRAAAARRGAARHTRAAGCREMLRELVEETGCGLGRLVLEPLVAADGAVFDDAGRGARADLEELRRQRALVVQAHDRRAVRGDDLVRLRLVAVELGRIDARRRTRRRARRGSASCAARPRSAPRRSRRRGRRRSRRRSSAGPPTRPPARRPARAARDTPRRRSSCTPGHDALARARRRRSGSARRTGRPRRGRRRRAPRGRPGSSGRRLRRASSKSPSMHALALTTAARARRRHPGGRGVRHLVAARAFENRHHGLPGRQPPRDRGRVYRRRRARGASCSR